MNLTAIQRGNVAVVLGSLGHSCNNEWLLFTFLHSQIFLFYCIVSCIHLCNSSSIAVWMCAFLCEYHVVSFYRYSYQHQTLLRTSNIWLRSNRFSAPSASLQRPPNRFSIPRCFSEKNFCDCIRTTDLGPQFVVLFNENMLWISLISKGGLRITPNNPRWVWTWRCPLRLEFRSTSSRSDRCFPRVTRETGTIGRSSVTLGRIEVSTSIFFPPPCTPATLKLMVSLERMLEPATPFIFT